MPVQSYSESMTGADNVRKGGATNGGEAGNPPATGAEQVTSIVGTSTPVIVKTGATNDGGK
jgi:hypothetical protein